MARIHSFINNPRIIPLLLALGFIILFLAFFGFSRQERKNSITQCEKVNEVVLESISSEISSLLSYSDIVLNDSTIAYQKISVGKYDYLSFYITNEKITIAEKTNEISDQTITSLINEFSKDSILDTASLSTIKFLGKSFLSILRFNKISSSEISGIIIINRIPIDSLFIKIPESIENASVCGIKFNNTPILPQFIDDCLKNNLETNLLSINDHYEFECDKVNRHYIGTSIDFNQSLRISSITPIEKVKKIWWILCILGLLLVLVVLVSYFASTKSVIAKQILEINNAVEALSSKDFDHFLSDNFEAELGILAKSINKMSAQFREIYRDLEIRVIRRTSEISMRNATLRKTQRDIIKQNLELSSAYEALKETREKYEKLIQHLEEEYIFYSQSINGDLLFVSPSVTKILGFEVQEYRKLHDTLYSENPINIIARERSSNTKLGIAQPKFLKEIIDKEGKQKILEVSEVPIYNEEGKLVSVEGLAHNITEKQKAEELIKEQEEKYRMLFTLASDIIFLYEIDKKNKKAGHIIEANNFMIEKLGYSIEELRQKTPVDMLAVEFSEEEQSINSEFLAEDDKYERIWETKTGEAINVEISSHAFKIKDKNVVIAVARDITERKQVEDEIRFINEELYNQNENLEALVDNLTQTQEQLVQSEKMAALGQLIAGIAHEINTPLGAIKASIGNLSDSLEHALGELPSLFQNQSKENLVLFTMLFELSRKKSPELSSREKRQVKKDLTSILKENSFEDPETIADLLVYLEIYEISDELIQNLKINDALEVVRSARNFISLVKNTNTINLAVEKATKVVFALKKYAHRDTMGEKLPTDILDSIETVLTLYSNQLKQGIEVIRKYEKLPQVPCYQDEISQVWTNLIQNAIQAMNQEGKLTITSSIEENMVKLSFKDTGVGITPDIKDKIFEPFFTTKKQGEGSGLGLDIVKKIIEKHDGFIYVESKLGEGANFIIKLPLE
jgi:PAS domain S-box-containing protein